MISTAQSLNSINMSSVGFEIGILLEEVSINNPIAKISIPTITPTATTSNINQSTVPTSNNGNRMTNGSITTKSITKANYFEVSIPTHMFSIKEITIQNNLRRNGDGEVTNCSPQATIIHDTFKPGQKFLVTLNLDPDKPIILGVI